MTNNNPNSPWRNPGPLMKRNSYKCLSKGAYVSLGSSKFAVVVECVISTDRKYPYVCFLRLCSKRKTKPVYNFE